MGYPARTNTEYDSLGRVHRVSKPHFDGAPIYWTTTQYDWLGRAKIVTDDLGDIDGTGKPAQALVNTIYNGSSIETHRFVSGKIRRKVETKNVLGKVSQITDDAGSVLRYFYDVEGNLTDTSLTSSIDTSKNVHIEYDLLGRKVSTKDPDLGEWSYGYNGFGDLVSQTDGKHKTTTMTYDALGRMLTKTDETGTAEWVYDVATGAGKGKLAAMISAPDGTGKLGTDCSIPYVRQTGGNRVGRSYSYNSLGDIAQTDECVEGETFTTKFDYDELWRQKTVTYPAVNGSSFTAKYKYTGAGFLHAVVDGSDDSLYWALKATDASGQVKDEILRNGVETLSTRNQSTGWLMESSSLSLSDNLNEIQGWKNTFDEAGNLRTRRRYQPSVLSDSVETFGYDNLDRLTTSEVKIPSDAYAPGKETFRYDSIGNVMQKGGKTYFYTGCAAGGGPHTVCKIGNGDAFSYDPNGNLTSGNGREITYTPSNKVSHIKGKPDSQGGAAPTVDFVYGSDGNRVMQVSKAGNGDESRTIYVGLGGTGKSMYERTTSPSTIEQVHFLYAGPAHGGNAFAINVIKQDRAKGSSERSMRYYHFDHLGSVTAMSDQDGRAASTLGFDPWGLRRNADGRAASAVPELQAGHREFTGHEAIPDVGLVNMNGRVYDPEVGRFLSPDPNVQFLADLQSFNRYSYGLNNPLRYTDPTGYFISPVFDIMVNAVITVAAAVVCAYSAGAGCAMAFAMVAAVYNTTSAHYSTGMGWGNAVGIGLMSMAASGVAGAATGAMMSGANIGGIIIGGAISGAAVSAYMTEVTGGNLGSNLLAGALSGAAGAAFSAGLASGLQALSEASADVQAGGGGSDAARVESRAVGDAQIGGEPDDTEGSAEGGSKKGGRGETKIRVRGAKITATVNKNGIVTSVKQGEPSVDISTTYTKGSDTSSQSAYGRGTTDADIKAGKTTLEDHEESHREDLKEYVKGHPLPKADVKAGMTAAEFKTALKVYQQQIQDYGKAASDYTFSHTDCVGVKAEGCH